MDLCIPELRMTQGQTSQILRIRFTLAAEHSRIDCLWSHRCFLSTAYEAKM